MTESGSAPFACVLDASALLAYLHGEPGGETVRATLASAVISSVNWAEVVQKAIALGLPISGRRAMLTALGLTIEPFTADDAEQTALLWPQTRALGLSLGDRACLALGQRLGLPVLTADRAWERLPAGIAVRLVR